MLYTPGTFIDKLGREAVLRSAGSGDAPALIEYLKRTAAESRFLVREPDEADMPVDAEERFISAVNASERSLMLVAVTGDRLMGVCSLTEVGAKKRLRHRCSAAIALYKEYCGAGVGTLMMEALIRAAAELGYEQIELEVVSDNVPAIRLYEKLGFEKTGVLPRFMKYADGSYADAYWMVKRINEQKG